MRNGSRAAGLNSHTNIVVMMTMTLMAFKTAVRTLGHAGHGTAMMMKKMMLAVP